MTKNKNNIEVFFGHASVFAIPLMLVALFNPLLNNYFLITYFGVIVIFSFYKIFIGGIENEEETKKKSK